MKKPEVIGAQELPTVTEKAKRTYSERFWSLDPKSEIKVTAPGDAAE